jgi:hypothetical protein
MSSLFDMVEPSLDELQQWHTWTSNRIKGHCFGGLSTRPADSFATQFLPVRDVKVKQLMTWTNSLPRQAEINMRAGNHPWCQFLRPLVIAMRERYSSTLLL